VQRCFLKKLENKVIDTQIALIQVFDWRIPMGYKIGSFNMRNLGLAAMGNSNARDLNLIAEIIRKEEFDVVALQEILGEGKAFVSPDYAKKSILMELGSNWDFEWADTESNLDKRHEGYAFLWNKRRLRLATTELENHTTRIFYPRICRLSKMDLNRKPFYARFTPNETPTGGPYIELRLLCVHTYYGKDSKLDREIRTHELDVLLTDIYPQIADRVYKGNMKHYTLLMGDYNVELRRPWKDEFRRKENTERSLQGRAQLPTPLSLNSDDDDVIESTKWGKRRIKTVQDQFTTLKSKDREGQINPGFEGRGYVHDYDHFSFEEKQFDGVTMKVHRIDAVRKYCSDDFEQYLNKVSDHIPIMMEIELK